VWKRFSGGGFGSPKAGGFKGAETQPKREIIATEKLEASPLVIPRIIKGHHVRIMSPNGLSDGLQTDVRGRTHKQWIPGIFDKRWGRVEFDPNDW